MKLLSIVIPTYNNSGGIHALYSRLATVLETLNPLFSHEIIFVNDFSTDSTAQLISTIAKNDKAIKLINFSRNFGNQTAIAAGLHNAVGDICIIMDDDLQDPPEVIPEFIDKWAEGYKVVYGIRSKRSGESGPFKLTSYLYYRLLNLLSDVKIPVDTGDFRLLDRVVIDALLDINESDRYYRGLVSWVGFPQIGVYYERDPRYTGKSNFSISKYIKFASDGILGFSTKPLVISMFSGLFITAISFLVAISMICYKIYEPSFSIPGWTSLFIGLLFFGGIQLMSIGILGLYIGKIFNEVKKRPLYIIESSINL
jgi:dolichol-phosphate mannosyltransferase